MLELVPWRLIGTRVDARETDLPSRDLRRPVNWSRPEPGPPAAVLDHGDYPPEEVAFFLRTWPG